MKRKSVWAGLAFVAVVAALALFLRGDDKTRIERLVLRNTEELEKIALLMQSDPLAKSPDFPGVQQITADPFSHTVKFGTFAWGIGSETSYRGFYYAQENAPVVLSQSDGQLTPKGDGWQWTEPDGDNWQYTEKIAEKWYYYEMHF